jgi:SAM-dependent methyltransferase
VRIVQTVAVGVRSKFAGGDQTYLRDEQYRDETRLAARARLHLKYRTSRVAWPDWVLARLDLVDGAAVLEAGCGAGWLWTDSTEPVPSCSLTLTDLSPGMVEHAAAAIRVARPTVRLDARAADLQAMPFADRSFDRIVANHMLYHLPDPAAGVREIARLVRQDGTAVVATNGRRHLRELNEVRAEVFGTAVEDATVEVFGVEVGFVMLRDVFDDVQWLAFPDELRCTDPADVVAYIRSLPPGDEADAEQVVELERAVERAFERGGGVMTIGKDTGCFVCRRPVVTAVEAGER